MANENKEIGDIVKKCKILLLDIEGTTTSISFVKDKLFPYAEENVKQFLETQWESDDVKEVVTALRKLALEDQENSVEGLVTIPGEDASKEDQIEGLVNNVKWQMSSDRKAGPLKQLQGLIWKQGYDKGDIKGHVYDDVSSALEQWQSVDGQKVYIYSSGSVQAQKLLFGQSLAGDLLPYIEGHFDTAVGAKQEAASYSAIVEKIGCKAEDVLFLTDIVKEAEAARSAGLHVVLVSREGNAPLPSEATDSFTVIHSLGQLSSNKRKTDPQEEQRTKVPKTDMSNDVKTTTETATTNQETAAEKKESEPEKMEVEEESAPITEESNKIEEVIVEEVTDVKDDIPIVEAEPVVIECDETKADNQETEKMETEVSEKVEKTKVEAVEKKAEIEVAAENPQPTKLEEAKSDTDKKTETTETLTVPIENVEVDESKEKEPIAEETPPAIITEIEEITDKENLPEMTDIIEDLEPVVEEPNGAEDIELQNVGDVLEKECDEILSKVQDVTNLDNIPLKSTLNTIAEETMDTDNLDSNDIMERILDSEELEKKQFEESSAKMAADVAKTDKVADNTEKPEEKPDVEEETKRVETKGDDATSAITVNSASDVVKETENTDQGTAPEETAKESPQKDELKSETVIDKEETKVEESSEIPEHKTEETSTETKDSDQISEEQKTKEVEEPQVNGEATNGENQSVNQNGDASNNEDLSSRLSVENGKEVNGSNGDSMDAENGTNKVKADVADIKVKTVTTEEPQSEPIEHPTEA